MKEMVLIIAKTVKLTFVAINLQRFRRLVHERTIERHIGLSRCN